MTSITAITTTDLNSSTPVVLNNLLEQKNHIKSLIRSLNNDIVICQQNWQAACADTTSLTQSFTNFIELNRIQPIYATNLKEMSQIPEIQQLLDEEIIIQAPLLTLKLQFIEWATYVQNSPNPLSNLSAKIPVVQAVYASATYAELLADIQRIKPSVISHAKKYTFETQMTIERNLGTLEGRLLKLVDPNFDRAMIGPNGYVPSTLDMEAYLASVI